VVQQLLDRAVAERGRTSTPSQKSSLTGLDRFAEKSARSLIEEIDRSKTSRTRRVLMALGIRCVGERTAEFIVRGIPAPCEALRAANAEELERVEEVGRHFTGDSGILRAAGESGFEFGLADAGVVMTAEKKQRSAQLAGSPLC